MHFSLLRKVNYQFHHPILVVRGYLESLVDPTQRQRVREKSRRAKSPFFDELHGLWEVFLWVGEHGGYHGDVLPEEESITKVLVLLVVGDPEASYDASDLA
eukprot:CAMPEP_0195008102 /NCGR_PEP_ID=MMETSP0326_2-20130528/8184_1 /TAXON_ID=2866 ORGANISM="Crypthecodinium cohnii, Strain Seligo" /NCGR_SAMPLE_ID=MMETSP0326_2 /ASSEMBLY_ACC=CAM_ASM_000348 /LENGTH=100 /DNA_ID=CAMNT_0040015761 /DNA_START=315 /DNA_END=617 /DNA_ORIENTATION=+